MKISENTTELFAALRSFQGEIKNPATPANNPFFKSKYTPLDYMIEHIKPVLEKFGMAVVQFPCSSDGAVGVVTLITHDSGQYIESDPYFLPLAKKDPQAGGSAITYARRYALAAALGIASDPDDDGNEASKSKEYKCEQCGKKVNADIAEKSIKANGAVFCSGTCKKKKENLDYLNDNLSEKHANAGDR